jgi:curved DNA-binding protein CbpA
MQSNYKNYYQILGVPKNASHKKIDKAYCKLSSQWHPSNHEDNYEEAQEKSEEISEAYAVLSNKLRRDAYDKKLMNNYVPKTEKQKKSPQASPRRQSNDLFKIFFGNWHPFSEFDRNFFGESLFDYGKNQIESSRKELLGETIHSDEEDEGPSSGTYSRQMYSTTSSTTIKNGERTTKTKKTMIGPDGTKKIKIIEETEDKNGTVNRSVKCLKNGKEVQNYQKQITAGEEMPQMKKAKSLTKPDNSSSKRRNYP